jgi:hypothetical protein
MVSTSPVLLLHLVQLVYLARRRVSNGHRKYVAPWLKSKDVRVKEMLWHAVS